VVTVVVTVVVTSLGLLLAHYYFLQEFAYHV
jgi:hypothetical protein